MSRYHQLPRESMDSDRDDADHQYLIPSPQSGSVEDLYTSNTPPRPKGGLTINAKTLHRILSGSCSLTAFLIMILQGGYTFIASSVFVMIALIFNIHMLLFTLFSRFVRFSIYYNDRDILDNSPGTFRRPSLVNYLDLLVGVGIFIPLTIALSEHNHENNPVASAILGYIVIAIQLVLAIPAIGSLRFSIRRVNVQVSLKTKEERSYSVSKADRKISMMVGAIDVDAEETAIPAPLTTVEPVSEVAVDLV